MQFSMGIYLGHAFMCIEVEFIQWPYFYKQILYKNIKSVLVFRCQWQDCVLCVGM